MFQMPISILKWFEVKHVRLALLVTFFIPARPTTMENLRYLQIGVKKPKDRIAPPVI